MNRNQTLDFTFINQQIHHKVLIQSLDLWVLH
ncbi:Uncharacterised protein [Vibrio cholerae]|uniref:Uncharacterized protein n=1 Tax=Vibrio cholerae TaxID=666 RepID=A0A655WNJ8_VIBCL|nr:Uncharacterised protein [Vibrio cholerae]CSI66465.1 Uncharacterised protein [Vibrio cholerae]CSI76215.1 Uncharacterised protein [Vibrio cholerae]